jgi:hypothetical protein
MSSTNADGSPTEQINARQTRQQEICESVGLSKGRACLHSTPPNHSNHPQNTPDVRLWPNTTQTRIGRTGMNTTLQCCSPHLEHPKPQASDRRNRPAVVLSATHTIDTNASNKRRHTVIAEQTGTILWHSRLCGGKPVCPSRKGRSKSCRMRHPQRRCDEKYKARCKPLLQYMPCVHPSCSAPVDTSHTYSGTRCQQMLEASRRGQRRQYQNVHQ